MFERLRSFFGMPQPETAPMAVAVEPTPALPPRPVAVAVADAVLSPRGEPITWPTLFQNGRIAFQPMFRYNVINELGLGRRMEVLRLFAQCTQEQFMALPYPLRRQIFAFLAQEGKRYMGTAVRQAHSEGGLKGSPLPKLRFPTTQKAVLYREQLRLALEQLRRHVATHQK